MRPPILDRCAAFVRLGVPDPCEQKSGVTLRSMALVQKRKAAKDSA